MQLFGVSAAALVAATGSVALAQDVVVETVGGDFWSGRELVVSNGQLYFQAESITQTSTGPLEVYESKDELWRVGETESTATRVTFGDDFSILGQFGSAFVFERGYRPRGITAFADGVAFVGARGLQNNPSNGQAELQYGVFRVNAAGNLVELTNGDFEDQIQLAAVDGDTLVFSHLEPRTAFGALYSAGLGAGSAAAVGGAPPVYSNLTSTGNGLVFYGGGNPDIEPVRTDGTAGGTFALGNLNPTNTSQPAEFAGAGATTYFTATQSIGTPGSLYKTDGTAGGTLAVSGTFSQPTSLSSDGERVYFLAKNGSDDAWYTADEAGNVTFLHAINGAEKPQADSDGSGMFILGRDAAVANEFEVWFSNGTVASEIANIVLGSSPVIYDTVAWDGGFAFATGSEDDSVYAYRPEWGDVRKLIDGVEVTELAAVGETLFVNTSDDLLRVTVPEPTALAMLGASGLLLGGRRRAVSTREA